MTSFDPLNIDLESLNLHHEPLLCRSTYLPNFVFLAHLEAEIAGGGQLYAPPQRLAGGAGAQRLPG